MKNEEKITESLDLRLKKVELIKSIDDARLGKYEKTLEIEKKKLENVKLNQDIENKRKKGDFGLFGGPLSELLSAASTYIIDNEKTVTSDPVFKSLWNENEMSEIKSLILKKIRTL